MKIAVSRKNLWERSPWWIKTYVGTALRLVPPGFLLGKQFRDTLQFVDEAQWWPAERAREWQLEQLRSICRLAYEHTQYYRRSFDAVGFDPGDLNSLEDLRRLQLIDKGTVRENMEEMATIALTSPSVDYVATGGSSGRILRFYIGADRSATEYAYLLSSWGRAGYGTKCAQAVFRGQIVKEDRTGLLHGYDPILRRHYYSNFHMTDANVRAYLQHVSTIGPCYLQVYPSSCNALASAITRQDLRVPENIRGILAGSENVYPGDREAAEEVFGVRYLSWYGHCEKLVLASECEHSTAYHVWPTYGYCELLDDAGNPVTEVGKSGQIVGTGFINRVIPFIRYQTGDRGYYGGDSCAQCGREHLILTKIEGRWPQGCLVARDGSKISMTAINLHDDTMEDVIEYQFHQRSPGKAVCRVVAARPLNDAQRARIIGGMNARLQGQVELTLETQSELDKTERGKLVRVVQEIPGVENDGETV